MNVVLVGAGGHAKAIVEALLHDGHAIACYVDPVAASWLEAEHVADGAGIEPGRGALVMGLGGADAAALKRRLALLDRYLARGFEAPPVVHPTAHVSRDCALGAGVVVLAGAIVQPSTALGRGAIINSAAIVEHDSSVGAGSHLAPRALLLGGCVVGDTAVIGAGAVVLPGGTVEEGATVPALTRHPR